MKTKLKSLAGPTARIAIGLLAAAFFSATPVSAAKIGYYDLETGQGEPYQAAAITAAGHTPVQLFTLSSGELAGVDVLLALNPSNFEYGTPPAGGGFSEYVAALPAITTAVHNGLVLVFADRRVTEAAARIPGADLIIFSRDPVVDGQAGPPEPSADINVFDSSTLVTNGPRGVVTNTNLDGGTFSNHGFALRASLPNGSKTILVRTSDVEAVTFSYPLGAGSVVYTTVPLDAYLAGGIFGSPSAEFKNIYGPNLIAYGASLTESSSLGPISLRYCHSAGHTGEAACTRLVGAQTLSTTGKVASVDLPQSACAPGQPTKGTANVRVIADDKIALSWNDLNCDTNANSSGSESFLVNPTITSAVGNVVQLSAERLGTVVRLRVVPRETDYDLIDNVTKGVKRIVVESLNDGKVLEKWAINGDERISARLTDAAPDDVLASAAVRFWLGHTRLFGAKTILAKAKRNGTAVGVAHTRVLSAVPKSTFSELQVYTPANFGVDSFDEIEFSAAPGSYFGVGSIDLNTNRPASP